MTGPLHRDRVSGVVLGQSPGHGHVHVVLGPTGGAEGATGSDWEQRECALAAWKARSLLSEAEAHLRRAVTDHACDRVASDLAAALEATSVAIAALQAVRQPSRPGT